MSNVDAPDVGSGEINNPDLLAEQSGMPNMSSTKTFTVDTNMQVNGDLDVTGTVTATSFIGDGSQLTGISGGTGGGLDSAAVTLLVDSDYVQAREVPQDFAYSSLTGAPTALSSFTNDTNYITAADIPATVDSDYVAARAPAASGGLDSAGVQSLIDADLIGSGINSVAIGEGASTPSADNTVAVGINAEAAADYAVSIGDNATVSHPAVIGIAIGRNTSVTTPGGVGGVAIGSGASVSDNDTLAIGRNTVASAADATAIGPNTTASGLRSIAIGNNVAAITDDAVSIGSSVAGRVTYDTTNDWTFGATVNAPAFVGDGSGLTGLPAGGGLDSAAVIATMNEEFKITTNQVEIGSGAAATGGNAVAIGRDATAPSVNSLSIGYGAGNTTGGDNTVLIGTNAGSSAHLRATSVAIGMNAQLTNDANVSATVAVGYDAGKTRQESSTVAIGYKAGETDQLNSATAVGFQAGNTSQGVSSVAIGRDAAFTGQATNSVAIGRAAGYENQGTRSIAIGRQAGALNQGANNIILNATSGALDRTDQFGIDIRTSAAGSLTYDTTNDWTFGAGVTMTDLTASGATVVFSNLPTTDPVNAGQLWNDAGTMKISAG